MSKPSASDPRAGTSQTLLSKRAHLFDIRVNLQVAADFPVSLSSDDIRDEKVIKQTSFPILFAWYMFLWFWIQPTGQGCSQHKADQSAGLCSWPVSLQLAHLFSVVNFRITTKKCRYGKSADGTLPSYLDDKTVPPGSVTPTWAWKSFQHAQTTAAFSRLDFFFNMKWCERIE